MGYQLDPSAFQMTAEQMAALAAQAQAAYPFTQAAFAQAVTASAAAAAGGAAAMPAYPPPLPQQLLAQHMAVAAATPFPLALPPAQAPINTRNDGPNPRNDRHFWKEHEQQELLRLVADQAYRLSILGALLRC